MKLKHVVIGSAAILAVVAAVAVGETQVAKRHAWGIGGPFGHHLMGLAWKLDLNDAQRQQVKSLIAAERPTLQPLIQQLATAHQQMVAASTSGQFDEAKVRSIAQQQSQNIVELIVARQRLQSKFYELLTPEQRTKFDQLQQQRLQHMQKWMGQQSGTQQQ
jgi:protein CpxP